MTKITCDVDMCGNNEGGVCCADEIEIVKVYPYDEHASCITDL